MVERNHSLPLRQVVRNGGELGRKQCLLGRQHFQIGCRTVPHQVLDEALLAELPPDCLLIELASASGFDMDAVETLRLSYLKAGGLPGRVAPETAARAIKKTLCRLIKEEA